MQLERQPRSIKLPPAAGAAGHSNMRRASIQQQYGDGFSGLRSLLGGQTLLQQPLQLAASTAGPEEGTAAYPAAPPAVSTHHMQGQADDRLQHGREWQRHGSAGALSVGAFGTQAAGSSGCRSGSGRRPVLADASNRNMPPCKDGQEEMAWERQAESPDPDDLSLDAPGAAKGARDGSDDGRQDAEGIAGAEDVAGSMVQQCESIFSFL